MTLTESTHCHGTGAVNVSAENAYSALNFVHKLVKSVTFLVDLEFNIFVTLHRFFTCIRLTTSPKTVT